LVLSVALKRVSLNTVLNSSNVASATALFEIGQIVHHRLFDYRGLVIDVDADFQGGEVWYRQVARSRPPKDKPWYHVLVDNSESYTYVAEQNLEPTGDLRPIRHSMLAESAMRYENGRYFVERNLV